MKENSMAENKKFVQTGTKRKKQFNLQDFFFRSLLFHIQIALYMWGIIEYGL